MDPVKSKGDDKWSKASLWIGGDPFHPDQASAILGLQATKSGVKGERYSSRHNMVRRASFWYLECPLSDRLPLPEHLRWLLDLLEPKLDLINSITQKWRVEFFCGFSSEGGQGGITFDPSLLRRLANMGIPLVFDLYPPGAPLQVPEEQPWSTPPTASGR